MYDLVLIETETIYGFHRFHAVILNEGDDELTVRIVETPSHLKHETDGYLSGGEFYASMGIDSPDDMDIIVYAVEVVGRSSQPPKGQTPLWA